VSLRRASTCSAIALRMTSARDWLSTAATVSSASACSAESRRGTKALVELLPTLVLVDRWKRIGGPPPRSWPMPELFELVPGDRVRAPAGPSLMVISEPHRHHSRCCGSR
jgi:hypothetical protein